MRPRSAAPLFAAALLLSVSARAQTPAPGSAPAPDPAPTPTPAPTPDSAPPDSAYFRWGLSAYGGPITGGLTGGAGGLDARFGAQLSPMLGLYAQPIFMLGLGASASTSGASVSGLGLYGVGALADVTLSDLIYLAAGPELLLGGMAASSANVSTSSTGASGTTSASAVAGPFLSVAARAGFALGHKNPQGRRSDFTVGLDLHAIFSPGSPVIVPCLALGYDAF